MIGGWTCPIVFGLVCLDFKWHIFGADIVMASWHDEVVCDVIDWMTCHGLLSVICVGDVSVCLNMGLGN